MVSLPLLTAFDIKEFDLFPGSNGIGGIERQVQQGVTLVAGINGLGKTTLLMVLLRLFTGPSDLTSSGQTNVGSTLPEAALGGIAIRRSESNEFSDPQSYRQKHENGDGSQGGLRIRAERAIANPPGRCRNPDGVFARKRSGKRADPRQLQFQSQKWRLAQRIRTNQVAIESAKAGIPLDHAPYRAPSRSPG